MALHKQFKKKTSAKFFKADVLVTSSLFRLFAKSCEQALQLQPVTTHHIVTQSQLITLTKS